jgi:hypothetical protein
VLAVDRRLLPLPLVAALLALPLLATACAAPAPGTFSPSTTGAATLQSDWRHTLQAVANVRAKPPSLPVVYLLGGSVARECIVSEASWAAAVRDAGGPAALTYDLASGDRTAGEDLKLVGKLPRVPSIVLISVNVGRFTRAPSTPSAKLPAPASRLPDWRQHRYSTPLSASAKKALVTKWMQSRYPLFKQYYSYNLGRLEQLIKACQAKGLRPVLLDLPRNREIIGAAMDAPVTRYHRSCHVLADTYGIPWVNFAAAAKLVNRDFYDLWHLIRTGRAKWQPLLAARTAALLDKYGMGSSPTPTTSP